MRLLPTLRRPFRTKWPKKDDDSPKAWFERIKLHNALRKSRAEQKRHVVWKNSWGRAVEWRRRADANGQYDQPYCCLRRQRYVPVLEAFLKAYVSTGNVNAALIVAGRKAPNVKSDQKALQKASDIISRPDVMVAMERAFDLNGFSLDDCLQLHIAHIKGAAPKTANYQALKDYEGLVLPKAPTKMEIRTETTLRHEILGVFEAAVPSMNPRALDYGKEPAIEGEIVERD